MKISWPKIKLPHINVNSAIDRAVGTNLSGKNKGGAIARSDLGKVVGGYLTSAGRAVGSTADIGSDILRGDLKNAEKNFRKATGAALNVALAGIPKIIADDPSLARRLAGDKGFNFLTLGMAKNLSSTAEGFRGLEGGKRLTQDQWTNIGQLATKGATIATAVSLYNGLGSVKTAVDGAAGSVWGKIAANPLTSAGVAGLALSGKQDQAIKLATGIGSGDVTDDNSEDLINDLISDWFGGKTPNAAAPLPESSSNPALKIAAVLGLLIMAATFVLFKKRKPTKGKRK